MRILGRSLAMLAVGVLAAICVATPSSAATVSQGTTVQPNTCGHGLVAGVEEYVCPNRTAEARLRTGSGCRYGHFKWWDHDNTSLWKNSRDDNWCQGTFTPFYSLTWSANTCVEYFELQDGVWYRFGNIGCALP